MTHKKLIPAIRQYRHNNGEGLVMGYDEETTDQVVEQFDRKLKKLKEEKKELLCQLSLKTCIVQRLNTTIELLETKNKMLEAQLKESIQNDATGMYYLNSIRKAANHEGDFPSLVDKVKVHFNDV